MTRWGNLHHERLEVFQPGATEDLGLWLLESDHGVAAGLVYNADILDDQDVAKLCRNYASILAQIVSDPSRSPLELSEFGDADRFLVPRHEESAAQEPAPSAHEAPAASREPAAAGLESLVSKAMAEVLGSSALAAEDDFFEMGGHSIVAVQLFQKLRKDTGVNLPLGQLLAAPTPRALAAAYRRAGAIDPGQAQGSDAVAADPWAPLVLLQEGARGAPLFLVHAVGGNILNYRALARKLPPEVTVYGLQALGLDGKTPPLASVEAMASRYVDEIRQVQPHGPYRIAGGSMGGIIAYEMAQRLLAAGEKVDFLGLFDTSSGAREGPSKPGPGLSQRLAAFGPGRVWRSVAARTRLAALRLRVMLARIIGAELPHEVRYAEVHRVHYRAAGRYRVRPYPGDLVVYRAEDQEGRFPDSPTL
ncbi:MAG: hypothetical protein EOP91_15875, partial [Lysobacteraceae bacterium]